MLKRIEGFNDNTDITRRWDSSGTVTIDAAYARWGEGGVQCLDEDSYFEDSTLNAVSFSAGFGMYFSGNPSLDSTKPFFVAFSGSSPILSLALDGSNYIKAYGSSGQLIGTSSNVLTDEQWNYMEVAGLSAATGSVIVHVDETEEINVTGLMGSGTITTLRWAGINSALPSQYDDLYISQHNIDPANIDGLMAWYDVSDTGTLYQTTDTSTPVSGSGNPIGRWEDKSGNGIHLTQGTAGARPTWIGNAGGGVPGAYFDGGDYVYNNSAGGTTNQAGTVLAVVRIGETAASQRVFYSRASTSDTIYASFGRYPSTPQYLYFEMRPGGSNYRVIDTPTVASGTYALVVVQSTSSSYNVYVDGVARTITGNNDGVWLGDFGDSRCAIGVLNRPSIVSYWLGHVMEIVEYDTELSSTDRATVELYLANKWGLTGSTPFHGNSAVTTIAYSTGTTTLGVSGTTALDAVTDADDATYVYGYSGTALFTPTDWPELGVPYHGAEARIRGYQISGPVTLMGFTDSGSSYVSLVAEDATDSVVETRTVMETKPTGEAWGDSDGAYDYGVAIQVREPSPILYTPTLLFWLDAADATTMYTDTGATVPVSASGDAVKHWADKSGNGWNFTNSTANPLYITSGRYSQSVLRASSSLLIQNNIYGSSSEYTIFTVGRSTSTTGQQQIIDAQTGRLVTGFKDNDVTVYTNVWRTSTIETNTNWNVWTWYLDTSAPKIRQNGVEGTINAYTALALNGQVGLFSRYNSAGNESMNGDFGEIICYTSTLTTQQIVNIERHLASKWGIVYRG